MEPIYVIMKNREEPKDEIDDKAFDNIQLNYLDKSLGQAPATPIKE